jgi:hypothetical protein
LKSDVTLGSSCSPASLGNLKSTQTYICLELSCASNWNKKGMEDTGKIWWSLWFPPAVILIIGVEHADCVFLGDVTPCGLVDQYEHFGGTFY